MYPNLKAEQARKGLTNLEVAKILGISRVTYESKKKSGRFTVNECKLLCSFFKKDFNYLFSTNSHAAS